MNRARTRGRAGTAKSVFFGGVATLLLVSSFVYPLVCAAAAIPVPEGVSPYTIPGTGTAMALILFVVGGLLPVTVIYRIFDLVGSLRRPPQAGG